MTPRILIDSDSDGNATLDPRTGFTLETDMDRRDNLPAHVIPCPERREWPVEAWEIAR